MVRSSNGISREICRSPQAWMGGHHQEYGLLLMKSPGPEATVAASWERNRRLHDHPDEACRQKSESP